jgi:photosystem II stability/assembly factor-like uncharacterized protein
VSKSGREGGSKSGREDEREGWSKGEREDANMSTDGGGTWVEVNPNPNPDSNPISTSSSSDSRGDLNADDLHQDDDETDTG